MFQRFASVLFGEEELSRCRPADPKVDEDDDWILVNYLGESETVTVSLDLEQVQVSRRL